MALILVAAISLALGAAGGLVGGWKLASRHQINYKRRWLEANALLKEEQVKTGALAELEPESDSDSPWKVIAEPSTGGGYMYIYIINGKRKLKVQEVDMWPQHSFDRRMIEATKIARRSAAALDV